MHCTIGGHKTLIPCGSNPIPATKEIPWAFARGIFCYVNEIEIIINYQFTRPTSVARWVSKIKTIDNRFYLTVSHKVRARRAECIEAIDCDTRLRPEDVCTAPEESDWSTSSRRKNLPTIYLVGRFVIIYYEILLQCLLRHMKFDFLCNNQCGQQ